MKKLSVLFFAFITVLTCVLAAGCAGGKGKTQQTTASEAVSETETETAELPLNLPEANYDGYNFRVLTVGQSNVHWTSKEFYSETITGDALGDAVYARNLWLSENYGVNVSDIGSDNPYQSASSSALAGADDYDLFALHLNGQTATLAQNKLVVDLYKVPNLDLTQPYYDQNSVASLSVAHKLYCVTGDMLTMDNNATWVVLFNKKIAGSLNFDSAYGGSFYDLVKNYGWTDEVMFSAASAAASDLNGDGIMDPSDQWGIEGESYNAYALLAGSGITSFKKDADDIPYASLYSETAFDILNGAIKTLRDKSFSLYVSDWSSKYTDVWTECMDKSFSDGRVLFNFAGLNRVTLFRAMDTDFGILPVPKYSEEQRCYYCPVSLYSANCLSVPITVQDLDRTGLIIEAMSWKSRYTLLPAYYDVTLKGKASRDEESGEMLDIIFGATVFDLGNMYDWGGLFSIPMSLCEAKSADKFSSKCASLEKAVNTAVEKFIAAMGE